MIIYSRKKKNAAYDLNPSRMVSELLLWSCKSTSDFLTTTDVDRIEQPEICVLLNSLPLFIKEQSREYQWTVQLSQPNKELIKTRTYIYENTQWNTLEQTDN